MVPLTVFAQSAGAQPSTQNTKEQPSTQNAKEQPSTQDIEELKRRLAGLEKEVEALRKSVTELQEKQKSAARQEPKPSSAQSAGGAKGRANRVQVSLQYNLYRKPGDTTRQ
jgi:flagellar motility protein MotE (MotC chaperone)